MLPCLQDTLVLLALLRCLVHPREHNVIQRHLSLANMEKLGESKYSHRNIISLYFLLLRKNK